MDLGGGLGPPSSIFYFYFFFYVLYISFLGGPPFKTLGPHSPPIRLASLTQLATIQSKNLTKTIKTFAMVIVF